MIELKSINLIYSHPGKIIYSGVVCFNNCSDLIFDIYDLFLFFSNFANSIAIAFFSGQEIGFCLDERDEVIYISISDKNVLLRSEGVMGGIIRKKQIFGLAGELFRELVATSHSSVAKLGITPNIFPPGSILKTILSNEELNFY